MITFLTTYQYLSHLAGITVKLQSLSLDIFHTYSLVNDVKAIYKEVRKTINEDFRKIYDQAVRMAAQISVGPAKPRASGKYQHRPNAPAESVEAYYLCHMAIPFVDHIIDEFEVLFSLLSVTSSALLGLIPSVAAAATLTFLQQ